MDEGITYLALAKIALFTLGIFLFLGGTLTSFGAGQAASPTPESERTVTRGCIAAVIGFILMTGVIVHAFIN